MAPLVAVSRNERLLQAPFLQLVSSRLSTINQILSRKFKTLESCYAPHFVYPWNYMEYFWVLDSFSQNPKALMSPIHFVYGISQQLRQHVMRWTVLRPMLNIGHTMGYSNVFRTLVHTAIRRWSSGYWFWTWRVEWWCEDDIENEPDSYGDLIAEALWVIRSGSHDRYASPHKMFQHLIQDPLPSDLLYMLPYTRQIERIGSRVAEHRWSLSEMSSISCYIIDWFTLWNLFYLILLKWSWTMKWRIGYLIRWHTWTHCSRSRTRCLTSCTLCQSYSNTRGWNISAIVSWRQKKYNKDTVRCRYNSWNLGYTFSIHPATFTLLLLHNKPFCSWHRRRSFPIILTATL